MTPTSRTNRLVCIALLLSMSSRVYASVTFPADTTSLTMAPMPKSRFTERMDHFSSSRLYQMTCVSVPLIVGGLIVKEEDDHFRRLRTDFLPGFHTPLDNVTQYLPAAVMLGLKTAGIESRSSWPRMLVSDGLSTVLMAGVVESIKRTTKVTRPDGSDNRSFPSGHTATAFMTATMLSEEYGHLSPWVSVGGYTLATATALGRLSNNRHWLSDVMVGAGIGIITTKIGYLLGDVIFRNKGLNVKEDDELPDDKGRGPSFAGLYLGFTKALGSYHLDDGRRLTAHTGCNAGAEGAWFFSRYAGIGGRLTVGNFLLQTDGKPQNFSVDMLTSDAGLYFSLPITKRWSAGSKLLAGMSYQTKGKQDTQDLNIDIDNAFTMGTGLHLTYRPNRNFLVRFNADYDVLFEESLQHLLTIGASACVLF